MNDSGMVTNSIIILNVINRVSRQQFNFFCTDTSYANLTLIKAIREKRLLGYFKLKHGKTTVFVIENGHVFSFFHLIGRFEQFSFIDMNDKGGHVVNPPIISCLGAYQYINGKLKVTTP